MSNMPAATRAKTDDSSVSYKSLADLTPDPRNANKGSARGNAMIADSLREYGAGRSILLDRNGRIIAGNKTHENASAAGLADVIVVQSDGTKLVAVQRMDLDLDDPRAKQMAIADNRSGQVSLDWDIDVLKELSTEIDLAPFWSVDELEALWPQNADLLTDEDDVPDLPEEAVTKPGDLYILGRHRLLCGDSTCIADVERLMGGAKADMVFVWDKENTGNFADAELAWTNQKKAIRLFKHMWNGMMKASEHGQKRVHPTQKPVALAEWAFNEYGKSGDVVLDLFGGSGSTMIACEKTGRAARLMEIDPRYCDVIVQRWQDATGQKAVLDGAAA